MSMFSYKVRILVYPRRRAGLVSLADALCVAVFLLMCRHKGAVRGRSPITIGAKF